MSDKVITLEGSDTPDIPLHEGEEVLMDVSQGFRDLGIKGMIFKHKGRLIATNQKIVYFKKLTKDYEIEQMKMEHAGYVKMGYNVAAIQMIIGVLMLVGSLGLMGESVFMGLIGLVISVIVIYTARVQGLKISGSGESIDFSSKSIPASELSKILTIISAN